MAGQIELFLAWRLLSTYPTLCYKEIWISSKIKVLPPETLSQIPDLETISPRQVDHVINKSRRRRRSSLLTTPVRQLTSRGCLLQVDQL